MTAGLPGAGIGGIFYMLSAIAMPFHAAHRAIKRRLDSRLAAEPPVPWRSVFRQFMIAVGIIAALWLTGWALAVLLAERPSALGAISSTFSRRTVPNVIKVGALLLSFGTVCVVLVAVEIGQLVVHPGPRRTATVNVVVGAMMLFTPSSLSGQTANVRSQEALQTHLTAAESAYQASDSAVAAAEYQEVLALDPNNSRALFRLALLWRHDPKRSVAMFRRYTSVVPDDPWGYMALGDELAVQRSFSEALRQYDQAARLAPAERDVALGRARVLTRAGRTDDAIALLEKWTALHPNDAEALRDLGDQRRRAGRIAEAAAAYAMAAQRDHAAGTLHRLEAARATLAPAVELSATGGGDSDGNRGYRLGALVSAPVGDRVRMTVNGGRNTSSGFRDALYYDGMLGLTMRPLSVFRLEGAAGAVHTTTRSDTSIAENLAVGFVRAVWKNPGTAALVDLRASRVLLDAAPLLIINRVVRNEIAARVDLPVSRRIRLRGGAKADTYDAIGDRNTRTSLLGGVAASVTDAAEVAGVIQQISFDHATTSGYFAPRMAQLAELATYAELESESGRLVVVDAGVGVQRFAEFGSGIGKWTPAFRVMTQLSIPLRPGSEIRAGLDTYDSHLSTEVAPGTSWRYASASLSFRFALR